MNQPAQPNNALYECASNVLDRLLNSEEHTGDAAIPEVAYSAAQTIRELMASLETAQKALAQATPRDQQIEAGLLARAEILPRATQAEVRSVLMQELVGDYDTPDQIPEWAWVEKVASFAHIDNGKDGVWEFVLNLALTFTDVPDRLKPVLVAALQDNISYLIFHQGT